MTCCMIVFTKIYVAVTFLFTWLYLNFSRKVSPPLWYFTSALPRAMLAAMPLSLVRSLFLVSFHKHCFQAKELNVCTVHHFYYLLLIWVHQCRAILSKEYSRLQDLFLFLDYLVWFFLAGRVVLGEESCSVRASHIKLYCGILQASTQGIYLLLSEYWYHVKHYHWLHIATVTLFHLWMWIILFQWH